MKSGIVFFALCIINVGLWLGNIAIADDLGMARSRLIQVDDTTYTFETDIAQSLVWAIRKPTLPDRFRISGPTYGDQTGWVTVSYQVYGTSFTKEDVLLLPWSRTGVAFTAQWLDGSFYKAVFLREMNGIRVPLSQLLPAKISDRKAFQSHFMLGVRHFAFLGMHLLLIAMLVVAEPGKNVFIPLLWYSAGQALSMVLFEVAIPGFDLIFADILAGVFIVLLANASLSRRSVNAFYPILFFVGLLHGLSVAQEQMNSSIEFGQRVKALFACNLAMDVGHFVTAGIMLLVVSLFRVKQAAYRTPKYVMGTAGVFLIAVCINDYVAKGKLNILELQDQNLSSEYMSPASNVRTNRSASMGAKQLNTPIMNYLTIQSFEVRQEVLIQARTAVQLLGIEDDGMKSIPIESLQPIKDGILSLFESANIVEIDGEKGQLVKSNVEFVTLSSAGVLLRPGPVVESLDEGIIGITLIFTTSGIANDIQLTWKLFPESNSNIENTITDPFGGSGTILNPNDNVVSWKKPLSSYQVPAVEAVAYKAPKLPLLSILLLLVVLACLFLLHHQKLRKPIIIILVAMAFVFYPFIRTEANIPLLRWKPKAEQTSSILDQLLTNIYRSFEVRDENEVYDRLTTSITGDELTNIYLQNRQSMELENRGGARANVDQVEILAIHSIKSGTEEQFIADVSWTVGGSVNHFGHTHFRKNKYRALISFREDQDYWKISNIEPIEEERLL